MRMPSFKRNCGELTVAEIVEVVEEIDQSRISGLETSILNTAEKNDQFQATRRWNRLITGFYKEMERKRCRRLLKSYPDCFIGKAAIQFLLNNVFPRIVPNKPVDETNAEKFMEVLIKKNLIENVEDPKMPADAFKHNKDRFYRFLAENMAAEIEETNSMKRSNSLQNLGVKPLARSSSSFQRPPSNLDRRISSSYSTLHKLLKADDMINSNSMKDTFVRHPSSSNFKATTPDTIYEKIPETPQHKSTSSSVTAEDVDFLKSWKQSVRSVIQNDQLVFSLATQVFGDVIKWNSTQVGESGVVKIEDPKNDLPSEVKRCLKILMNWTPESYVTEGQSSTQILEKLCSKLSYFSPLVPEFEAKKLVKVWDYFNKQILGDKYDNHFVRNDLPLFATSTISTNQSIFSASTNSSLSSKGINYIDDYETPMPPRNLRAQFQKNIAAAASGTAGRSVDFDVSNASSGISEVFSCPNFKAALQAVLLSFPSTTRRTLHLICRYIKRITSNPNLKLHEKKSNLDYLIDRIGLFIFDFTANYISFKDAVCLIQIMVEKQTTIFAPSSVIVENAEKLYYSRTKGTPAPTINRYCHQIDREEYQRQAIDTSDELLTLLDSIIADENLSESQKKKKLESFRKTYPHLYVLRFPESSFVKPKRQPTPTRIVNRIRSLTRRASTKRT